MNVRSSLFILCAAASSLGAQAADSRLSAGVDSIARAVLASTGVPSASVAVVQHGRVVFASAYGDANLEAHTPATADMRYAIGSISKQFTASAVLLLQQDGKLRLDDPVGKYVPGLSRGNEVTVRQLLTHTSGYQDFWPQDYLMTPMLRSASPAVIVKGWASQPLDFEPGTRHQYSNTGYTIAAMVVEKASGMPFFQFVQQRLLDKVGLASARNFDANPRAVDATGYIRYGLGPLRAAPDAGKGWMFGAGMLAMTARDLAAWDVAMIGKRVLSAASYRELMGETRLKNGAATGYALGLDVRMRGDRFVVSHNGEVSGFTADNTIFPDDSAAIVVLTNQDAAPASGAIADGIAQLLFATEDVRAASRTSQARAIFAGLQKGTVDRSQFTQNANDYFGAQALGDFQSSLSPLGAPSAFVGTGSWTRGGMTGRSYRVTFTGGKTVRVWTYELPNGKLEQYQVAPIG